MTRYEAIVDGKLDFSSKMKYLYNLLNMSSGTNINCIKSEKNRILKKMSRNSSFQPEIFEKNNFYNSENCVFSQNLLKYVRTPMFVLQPMYDQWQIWHVLGKACICIYICICVT
jgi:hypothetical protein